MDKETLSNYGWVVIAVLVLSVMIALATPFGRYIETAVKSTTEGLFTTSQKAFNNMGLDAVIPDQTFDDAGSSNGGTEETPAPVVGSATFTDGTTLTWDELKLEENSTKYLYGASGISNTAIGNGAFASCRPLISITIPNSITTIGNGVFSLCISLTSITFDGTIEQWNAIELGTNWKGTNVPATVVHCSDGDVTI